MKNQKLYIALAVGLVALVAIIVIVLNTTNQRDPQAPGESPTVTASANDAQGSERLTVLDNSVVVGDDDAATKITIFADMQCPYCKMLEEGTSDLVKEKIDSGDIAVEYHVVNYLNPRSPGEFSTRAANLLAIVANGHPEAYLDVQTALFGVQPSESTGAESPSDEDLIALAKENGADLSEEEQQAVKDRKYEEWADNNTKVAKELGLEGVPTVVIDGELVEEASEPAEFVKILEGK